VPLRPDSLGRNAVERAAPAAAIASLHERIRYKTSREEISLVLGMRHSAVLPSLMTCKGQLSRRVEPPGADSS